MPTETLAPTTCVVRNTAGHMAAPTEEKDRQYGVVNVHPDFAATPSGLGAARVKK